jgi:GTP-binding protein EngB required for normal cell division
MGVRILQMFSGLPGPMQGLVSVAAGGSILSAVFYAADPKLPVWRIVLGVMLAVGIVLMLYQLVLTLRDKAKGGKMAMSLTRSSGASGKGDPAEVARRDELRKKFEEGVETFRKAGKDLYSLPWVLLVGPAGSGKTEAMRHSSVGFPPGLQDFMQGTGGTISMNWWFTNHAVVLDTAGRMFMQEADSGGSSEWKDFLKMLKGSRQTCPINGLLLVISSETLLKDPSEKIEKDAGAIARQLDLIQRTLDVRFPVYVVVTKCDKIIGFREFFEGLTDPNLQHQMLGWSNPAPLDEAFKPDLVEKHLDQVRQRLMRRRAGLMQNPVHTQDPMARRIDQVDEMFEFPDNMMRIAPRLKRYLEMIFVAGEWSPKPLFLRGIYFTSSMREGQALDMALAATLGVEVETLPGASASEKDRSYFLRDVFMSKVFKEKGLVTNASNVSKQLRRQRAIAVFGMLGVLGVFAVLMVLGYFSFRDSIGRSAGFWRGVQAGLAGGSSADDALISSSEGRVTYLGSNPMGRPSDFEGSDVSRRVDLIARTAERAAMPVEAPTIAKPLGPFLGFSDDYLGEQAEAHRAVFERTTLVPLLTETRSRMTQMIANGDAWTPEAIAALAELVRLQTYAYGKEPSAAVNAEPGPAVGGVALPRRPVVNVDALFRFVLTSQDDLARYQSDAKTISDAATRAYAEGFGRDGPAPALKATDSVVNAAVAAVLEQIASPAGEPDSNWSQLTRLAAELKKFSEAERGIQAMEFIAEQGRVPQTLAEHEAFAKDYADRVAVLDEARKAADTIVEKIGRQRLADVPALLTAEETRVREAALAAVTRLRDQLPAPGGGLAGAAAAAASAASAAGAPGAVPEVPSEVMTAFMNALPEQLRAPVTAVENARKDVNSPTGSVAVAIGTLRAAVTEGAPLLVSFSRDAQDRRAYALRFEAYDAGLRALNSAKSVAAPAGRVVTFASLLAAAEAERDRLSRDVSDRRQWQPSTEQVQRLAEPARPTVVAGRDTSIATGLRAIELAQALRTRGAAQAYLTALDGGGGVADLARQLAEERSAAGDEDFDDVRFALVPLSDAKGQECDPQFHPAAAGAILSDWATLGRMVRPESAGGAQPRILGGADLDRAVRDGATQFNTYVNAYIRYWRNAALVDAMPKVDAWTDFAAGIRRLSAADIVDGVKAQRDIVLRALDKVPDAFKRAELENARLEVRDGASLDSARLTQELDRVLTAWQEIATERIAPEEAAARIIDAYRNGQAGTRYFRYYRKVETPRLDYWNELLRRGVTTLRTAAATGLDRQWQQLLTETRGVPLMFGEARDIPFDQLAQLARAAQGAASQEAPAAAADDRAGDNLDPEIADELRALSGADRASGATREWLRKLSDTISFFTEEPRLSAEIYFETQYAAGAPGPKGDARSTFDYAALVVGGQIQGKAFLINTSNPNVPEELAGRLRVAIPNPQPTEIHLWRRDPGTAPPPPDDRIVLAGPYGPVGAVVRNGDLSKVNAAGLWTTPLISEQGYFLWIWVKTSPRALPPRERWPAPSTWPR